MTDETPKQEERKTLEQIKAENDAYEAELIRREKLKQEALMAGTAGLRQEPAPAKPETPKEYRLRIERELREGKYND